MSSFNLGKICLFQALAMVWAVLLVNIVGQKSSGDQSDSDCELIVLLSVLLCF